MEVHGGPELASRTELENTVNQLVEWSGAVPEDAIPLAEDGCLACRENVRQLVFKFSLGHSLQRECDWILPLIDQLESSLKALADDLGEESVVNHYLDNVRTRRELLDLIHSKEDSGTILRFLLAKLDESQRRFAGS